MQGSPPIFPFVMVAISILVPVAYWVYKNLKKKK